MKIAVRGGHNFSVRGASGIVDETIEDRKVKDAVIKYLKKMGHDVLDVTAPDSYNTVGSDLSYGVNKAESFNAELFISCHFNKAYDNYDGSLGTEVLVYSTASKNIEAERVLNEIVKLGFKNRGIKARPELYELRASSMTSMIVEACFIEATEDVRLYKKLGPDKLGLAIANGAVNGNLNVVPNVDVKPSKPDNIPSVGIGTANKWVYNVQKELNKSYGGKLILDGIPGPNTLRACPIMMKDSKGELVKLIQDKLISLGYSCGGFGSDGTFGNGTFISVKDFQSKNKLDSDGIIGTDTWTKLLGL